MRAQSGMRPWQQQHKQPAVPGAVAMDCQEDMTDDTDQEYDQDECEEDSQAAAHSDDVGEDEEEEDEEEEGEEEDEEQLQDEDEDGSEADDTGEEEDKEEEGAAVREQEVTWQAQLYEALSAAAPPSRFAVSGRLDTQPLPFLCPRVSVAGLGPLGLPLTPQQAAALQALAAPVPVGKDQDTAVDTAVPGAYQVDAGGVSIASSWDLVLQRCVEEVAAGLDFGDDTAPHIRARVHKLLLCTQEGHFQRHQRDVEAEPGAFGTLVVQLPCAGGHTGGRLVVRHKGASFWHNSEKESDVSLRYAAFFSECEHEVTPVTSGMRLVLVYHLVWTGPPEAAPVVTGRSPAEVALAAALEAWEEALRYNPDTTNKRLAMLLEHKYKDADLSWGALKGSDRAAARALATCPGLDAYLVPLTRTISGTAYYNSPCRWKRGWWDDEEDHEEDLKGPHEMDEVGDDDITEGLWLGRDGRRVEFCALDLPLREDEEEREDGDKGEFYDPDGVGLFPAAPRLEHTYYRTLLVLTPRSQAAANAAAAGWGAQLAFLRRALTELQGGGRAVSLPPEGEDEEGEGQSEQQEQEEGAREGLEVPSRLSEGEKAQLAKDAVAVLEWFVRARNAASRTSSQPAGLLPQRAAAYAAAAAAVAASEDAKQRRCWTAQVLGLGAAAVAINLAGASKLLLKLLKWVAGMAEGLQSNRMARAVAVAAAVLPAESIRAPLEDMVVRCMSQQPSQTILFLRSLVRPPPAGAAVQGLAQLQLQLATAATKQRLAPQPLVQLVAAISGHPQLQQELVGRLADRILKADAGRTKRLVPQAAAVLDVLDAYPQLQQQLVGAVAQGLAAAGPVQHLESCYKVLATATQLPAVQQQLVDAWAAAVRADTSGSVAAVTVAALDNLSSYPDLQQQLAAAAVDALAAAGPVTHLRHCLKLLEATKQQPAVQQQLVAAWAASVRADASGNSSAKTVAVLGNLGAYPQLQQQLTVAAVDGLAAAGPAAHVETCLQLLHMTAQQPEVHQQLAEAWVQSLKADTSGRSAARSAYVLVQLAQYPDVQRHVAAAAGSALAAAGPPRHVSSCMEVLAWCGEPAVQVKLVEAWAAAVAADASGASAVRTAAVLHQFGSPYLDLLRSSRRLQPQLVVAVATGLAAAATPDEHLEQWWEVLEIAQQQPALLDEVVGHLAAALKAAGGGLQVTCVDELLEALPGGSTDGPEQRRASPHHRQLVAAAAEALLSQPAAMTAQTEDNIVCLSALLLEVEELAAKYYDRFAAAVVKRPGRVPLLRKLLASSGVRNALQLPGVQRLVADQVAALQRDAPVLPPFSWAMPRACLPSNPQVEQFLRSERTTMTLTGFKDIKAARSAAASLSPGYSHSYGYQSWNRGMGAVPAQPANLKSGYTLSAVAKGAGRNAHVVVTKTRELYDQQTAKEQAALAELARTRALLRDLPQPPQPVQARAAVAAPVIDLT